MQPGPPQLLQSTEVLKDSRGVGVLGVGGQRDVEM